MKETVLWLITYVLVCVLLFYLYKKYISDPKTQLARADQKWLQSYIEENGIIVDGVKVLGNRKPDEPIEEEVIEEEIVQEPSSSDNKTVIVPQTTRIPIKGIQKLAKRISEGKKIGAKYDLQLQANYPELIEQELKKIKK